MKRQEGTGRARLAGYGLGLANPSILRSCPSSNDDTIYDRVLYA